MSQRDEDVDEPAARPLLDAANPITGLAPNGSEPRHLFAVISWGCAATTWLAKVLNSHPEILALHHGNLGVGLNGSDQRLDGVDYMWKLAYDGTGYVVAGDVHGVTRFTLPAIHEVFGELFSAAVVVRDPLPRLTSLLAQFARSKGREIFDLTYVDELVEARSLDLPDRSYETRLFVHAANMLNAVVEERDLGHIYLSEQLTTSAKAFAAFAADVTGGKVAISDTWVRDALGTARVNAHARREFELAPWQRSILDGVVTEEARRAYADLGYRSLP